MIDDFQKNEQRAERSSTRCRFWIKALDATVADSNSQPENNIRTIAVGKMTMLVRTHRLRQQGDSTLKDGHFI